MVCRVKNQVWETICMVYQGKTSDVCVCRDLCAPTAPCVLLWVIRDHVTARELVRLFAGCGEDAPFLSCFSWEGNLCYLFPYEEPRPVKDFFPAGPGSLRGGEQLAQQIVMACTSSQNIPYPLLRLMLLDDQVHMGQDGRIYLSWSLKLDRLDPEAGEAECAAACAKLLSGLLGGRGERPESFQLIEKKAARSSYKNFPELYRDLKLTSVPETRTGIRKRLEDGFKGKQDRLFQLLCMVCAVLAFLALAALLSQVIWGDVTWFRVLFRTFDQIGMETLR